MQKVTSFAYAFNMAAAVVYRDDLTSADYQVDPAVEYPNVFGYDQFDSNLPPAEFNCAATLIGPNHAISAAHCFDSSTDEFQVQIGGETHTVTEVIPNPCYNFKSEEPLSSDIAILVLEEASAVTPAQVFKSTTPESEDEVGEEIHVLGWGQSGNIGTVNNSNAVVGTFHSGRNIVHDIWNGMVTYTMTSPADGGLPLEAMAWDGDSGGPAFIEVGGELQIAGVNSFGFCCQYDNTDYYTRLGGVSYDWIQGILDGSPINPTCSEYPGYGLDVDARYAEDVFDEFDANEDDELSVNECKNMFRANGDIFKEISVNKIKQQCKQAGGSDNALDYDEFLAFVAGEEEEDEEGEGDDSECGQLYNKYNADNNSCLTWKEFWKLFRKESSDCDGLKGNQKKRCIKQLRRDARDIAEDFDENENNCLCWEEFQEICDEEGISTD